MNRLVALMAGLMAMVLLISSLAYAGGVTGVSSFSLARNVGLIYPGSNVSINFTMKLTNGTANTTYLILANSSQLAKKGITVVFRPGSGVPPFSGTVGMYLNSTVRPATYTITIETGGADPSSTQFNNFTLEVLALGSTGSTAKSTISTTAPTTASSAPTTTVAAPKTGSGSSSIYTDIIALVVVIIVIIIIAVVVIKARHKAVVA